MYVIQEVDEDAFSERSSRKDIVSSNLSGSALVVARQHSGTAAGASDPQLHSSLVQDGAGGGNSLESLREENEEDEDQLNDDGEAIKGGGGSPHT
jgi:hypothetical protein